MVSFISPINNRKVLISRSFINDQTRGKTKEQILEAASVAMMMAGGPALTHIPVVIDTLEALQQ